MNEKCKTIEIQANNKFIFNACNNNKEYANSFWKIRENAGKQMSKAALHSHNFTHTHTHLINCQTVPQLQSKTRKKMQGIFATKMHK